MKIGVCYYPEHVDSSLWRRDAEEMAEMGIRFVRIGEFCWSKVEPARETFRFEWLDEALRILSEAGLKVVMCTPTATPPKWLIDEHPSILPVDAEGRTRRFGSRRHYDYSSPVYFEESLRITRRFAERYGEHPAVEVWQTDNEHGCHDTVASYSENALKAFRDWLRSRYGKIEELNRAWGNVFWSQEYADFDSVGLPNLTVALANPSHRLDFWRFSSDRVRRFNRAQIRLLRALSPGRRVTHNSMGLFFDYDHHAFAEDVDFMSWDSYPLGYLAVTDAFVAEDKRRYLRTGHPDLVPLTHDLYRCQTPADSFWVMEQQPGPVNWAPYNPVPAKGMVRYWFWEAFAHGAETVSCFRWRQCGFAQEQEHAGLKYNDGEFTPFAEEVRLVRKEIDVVEAMESHARPSPAVALVFDYESVNRIRIQPQSEAFDPVRLHYRFYSAVRRLGLDVDVVPASPAVALENYDWVLVPCLPYASGEFASRLKRHPGRVVLGPRCFSKTSSFGVPASPLPEHFADAFDNAVGFAESLPDGYQGGLRCQSTGKSWDSAYSVWRESFRQPVQSDLVFEDGAPACLQKDGIAYLGFYPQTDFLNDWLAGQLPPALRSASRKLPEGVRRRTRGNLTFYFNLSESTYRIPLDSDQELIVGETPLPRCGVAVLARKSSG